MVIDWLFDWSIIRSHDQNSGRWLVDELDGSNLIIITALMNVWSSSFFVCGRFCHWRISSIVTCQIFQFEVINHHFIPFWQSKWPLSLSLFSIFSFHYTVGNSISILKVAGKISFIFNPWKYKFLTIWPLILMTVCPFFGGSSVLLFQTVQKWIKTAKRSLYIHSFFATSDSDLKLPSILITIFWDMVVNNS